MRAYTVLSDYYVFKNYSLLKFEVGIIITSIFRDKKAETQRSGINCQGHIANKRQSWDLKGNSLAPGPEILNMRPWNS